jgi:hypothetical protein
MNVKTDTPRHRAKVRRHAKLARQLIDACGGLSEAAENCDREKSSLSLYQTGHAFMPADVIADLEEYCGQNIYSVALAAARPTVTAEHDPLTESFELATAVADLLPIARALTMGVSGSSDAFDDAIARVMKEAHDLECFLTVNRPALRVVS